MKKKESNCNWWSLVEGFVWLAIVLAMLIFVFSSCERDNKTKEEKPRIEQFGGWSETRLFGSEPSSAFVCLETGFDYDVVCHKETGVCYIFTYHGGATPLYNADGTLYIYDKYVKKW